MISRKDHAILQKFGGHLKNLREERGLSLRDLSYACDVDNSKISKIEKGMINVTLITIFELATGLDVPPSELMNFLKSGSK